MKMYTYIVLYVCLQEVGEGEGGERSREEKLTPFNI
jgi:hypothetical protein